MFRGLFPARSERADRSARPSRARRAKSPPPGRLLRLEPLEERQMLSLGDLLQTLNSPTAPPQASSNFGWRSRPTAT